MDQATREGRARLSFCRSLPSLEGALSLYATLFTALKSPVLSSQARLLRVLPHCLGWCGPRSRVTRRRGRGLPPAQAALLFASAGVRAVALAPGAMLDRSRLALVLLAAAVSCAVAQHAPPVSELEPRRGEGRAGAGADGGAGVAGWAGTRNTWCWAAFFRGSVVSCTGMWVQSGLVNPVLG